MRERGCKIDALQHDFFGRGGGGAGRLTNRQPSKFVAPAGQLACSKKWPTKPLFIEQNDQALTAFAHARM